jgi:RNA polymerase sigma factor (sigma-70 family)
MHELIPHLTPLVTNYAKACHRKWPGVCDQDDLIQVGWETVLKHASKYRADQGYSLQGFAAKYLYYAMHESAIQWAGLHRVRTPETRRRTYTQVVEYGGVVDDEARPPVPDESVDPEGDLLQAQQRVILKKALATLTAQQQAIIQALYIDEDTVTEVSERLALTVQAVRKSHFDAKRRLRKVLRAHRAALL